MSTAFLFGLTGNLEHVAVPTDGEVSLSNIGGVLRPDQQEPALTVSPAGQGLRVAVHGPARVQHVSGNCSDLSPETEVLIDAGDVLEIGGHELLVVHESPGRPAVDQSSVLASARADDDSDFAQLAEDVEQARANSSALQTIAALVLRRLEAETEAEVKPPPAYTRHYLTILNLLAAHQGNTTSEEEEDDVALASRLALGMFRWATQASNRGGDALMLRMQRECAGKSEGSLLAEVLQIARGSPGQCFPRPALALATLRSSLEALAWRVLRHRGTEPGQLQQPGFNHAIQELGSQLKHASLLDAHGRRLFRACADALRELGNAATHAARTDHERLTKRDVELAVLLTERLLPSLALLSPEIVLSAPGPAPRASVVAVVVTAGPARGLGRVVDGPADFRVGRALDQVELCVCDPQVSKAHVLLEIRPPHCRATDLGSKNGFFINGLIRYGGKRPLPEGTRAAGVSTAQLGPTDTIHLGHSQIVVSGLSLAAFREEDETLTQRSAPGDV